MPIQLISADVKGYNVPYEGLYSESDAIGHSDLRKIADCPSKWHKGQKDNEPSESMAWGSLVDALLFGVGFDRFEVRPDTYTTDKGEVKPWSGNARVCQEWMAENEGKRIISKAVKTEAVKAVNLLRSDALVNDVLRFAEFQCWLAGKFIDDATGTVINVRGLVDIVPSSSGGYKSFLGDLKTTKDGTVSKWARKVEAMWYHAQAALYLDLWNKATGQTRDRFLHIVQENEPPYEIAHNELSERTIRLGRTVYQQAIETYARCKASGQWDGLDEIAGEWNVIEMDAYAEMRAGVVIQDADMPWDETDE